MIDEKDYIAIPTQPYHDCSGCAFEKVEEYKCPEWTRKCHILDVIYIYIGNDNGKQET